MKFGVVYSILGDELAKFIPLKQGAFHFFNLRNESLFDKRFKYLYDLAFVLHVLYDLCLKYILIYVKKFNQNTVS